MTIEGQDHDLTHSKEEKMPGRTSPNKLEKGKEEVDVNDPAVENNSEFEMVDWDEGESAK